MNGKEIIESVLKELLTGFLEALDTRLSAIEADIATLKGNPPASTTLQPVPPVEPETH